MGTGWEAGCKRTVGGWGVGHGRGGRGLKFEQDFSSPGAVEKKKRKKKGL